MGAVPKPCRGNFTRVVMSVLPFLILVFVLLIARGSAEIKTEVPASAPLSAGLFNSFISTMITPQLERFYKIFDQIKQTIMPKSKDAIRSVKDSRELAVGKAARSYHHASAAGGYGTSTSTYHYYGMGLDPINIVVSMSLLSFLLQALGSLLGHTGLGSPVVHARNEARMSKETMKILKRKKYKYPK